LGCSAIGWMDSSFHTRSPLHLFIAINVTVRGMWYSVLHREHWNVGNVVLYNFKLIYFEKIN
jgi:hypothetical protein